MAVGAVASAPAFAAHHFNVEGSELTSTQGIEGSIKSGTTSEFEQVGGGVEIKCTAAAATGTIEGSGKSSANKINFTGCTVGKPGPNKCVVENGEVENEVEVKTVKDTLVEVGGTLEDEFEPETGSTFVTLAFDKKGTATCSLSTVEVTGKALASIDNETEAESHAITFNEKAGSSKLKSGGKEDTFKLEENLKLKDDVDTDVTGKEDQWSAKK
jgi:hypothetical protein